ncbi:unnamed protein product [Pedinophyceae sp. YPF-701]|nr:unnamed protein product [Pedinophyceae sp. YPF-701]
MDVPTQALCSWQGRSVVLTGVEVAQDVARRVAGPLSTGDVVVYQRGRALCPEDALMFDADGLANVEVVGRLRGGGGDGGTTGAESRSSYLAMYKNKKVGETDKNEERIARWTRCQLSHEELSEPVVCDDIGSLYNKDAVIRALLAKAVPPHLAHLSLKTIFDVKLTRGGAARGDGARVQGEAGAAEAGRSPFVCPVSGVEMNGRVRFVAERGSGVVVSERALKQEGLSGIVEELVGGRKVADCEWVPINGSAEEVRALKEAMALRVAAAKKKKSKKGKAKGEAEKAEGALGVRCGAVAKKYLARDHVPEGASKEVWASLFTGDKKEDEWHKETYLSRGGARRMI